MQQASTPAGEALRRQGVRLTPQRQMVLSVIEQSHQEHLSAEAICQRVQLQYPFVSLSTIYRTLELLKQVGLVREVHLFGEQRFYESAGAGDHHHLLCRGCGVVLHAEAALLAGLREHLERHYHFTPLSLDLIATGYCETCRVPAQERGPDEETKKW
jgi:Fe2+ or Zn2+ uptake regulation protein